MARGAPIPLAHQFSNWWLRLSINSGCGCRQIRDTASFKGEKSACTLIARQSMLVNAGFWGLLEDGLGINLAQ